MKFRSVLILAAVFAALAATAVCFDAKPKSPGLLERENITILNLRGFDITGIALELQEPALVLEKEGGRWHVRRPAAMAADYEAVSALLAELEYLSARRVLKPEKPGETLDAAQYGLDGSARKIRVKTGGAEKVFVLGKQAAIGDVTYAKIEGSPEIYVMTSDVEKSFIKTPEDFRDRVVLAFDPEQILSLAVINPAGAFEVSFLGNGWGWKKSLKGMQVDQDAATAMALELRHLKFTKYLGVQEGDAPAWQTPLAKISVALKGETLPRVVLIGPKLPDGSYLAKLESKPDVFVLDAKQAAPLLKGLAISPDSPQIKR